MSLGRSWLLFPTATLQARSAFFCTARSRISSPLSWHCSGRPRRSHRRFESVPRRCLWGGRGSFSRPPPCRHAQRSFARAKGRIHIVGPHSIRRVGSVLERARASSRTLPDPPLCTRRRGDPAEGARRDVHKRMGEATAVPQRVASFAVGCARTLGPGRRALRSDLG